MSQQNSDDPSELKTSRDDLGPNSRDKRYFNEKPKPNYRLTPPNKNSKSEKLPAQRLKAPKLHHRIWGHLKIRDRLNSKIKCGKLQPGEQKLRANAIEYLFINVFGRPQESNWTKKKVIREIMDRYCSISHGYVVV